MTLTVSIDDIVAEAESSPNPGLLAGHESWERVRLEDVADILNGAPFSSSYFNKAGNGLPLIRIRDVGKASADTYYSGQFEDQYLVQAGDSLVGMDGDFRVAFWHGTKGLLNQRVCKITVRNHAILDPRFLVFVLQGYLDAIWERTSSVTVKHLSSRTIGQIPLPLPPLDEQQRIVAALEQLFSKLDAATQALRAARERASTMELAIKERAVTGRLTLRNEPNDKVAADLASILKLREARASKKRNKPLRPTKAVEGIPPHWITASVDELCWAIQYGTSAKAGPKATSTDVPVLRMGNLKSGKVVMDSLKYLPETHPDATSLTLTDGDVLFNRTNSAELVGKAAAYSSKLGRATFASYLIRCRTSEAIDPSWLALVINSPVGKGYVRSVLSQQVGQANVNGNKLAALPVPLPPLNEQREILSWVAEYMDLTGRVLSLCDGALLKARKLRLASLREAVAGRLVEQRPSDEPASELLARIRAERASAKPNKKARAPRTPKQAPAHSPGVTDGTYQQEELSL